MEAEVDTMTVEAEVEVCDLLVPYFYLAIDIFSRLQRRLLRRKWLLRRWWRWL